MKIIVQGHGIDVTGPLRDYAEKRITKLQEFSSNIQKAEVTLEVRKIKDQFRNQVAEITVWVSGKVIRASEGASDMYSAIDQVFAKLERQIEKHKGKVVHESRRASEKMKEKLRSWFTGAFQPKQPTGPVIVKVNRFAAKPLSPQDAAQEMEVLGHDFYMFLNSKTNQVNTIYRRSTGNYGLIEPELM